MNSRRRFVLLAGSVLAVCLAGTPFVASLHVNAASLPTKLADSEFWQLSSEFSEPNGFFRSDNLLSNESGFQYVLADLTRAAKSGRAYLGVGPEQNFTYIVALKPAMVFIVDIRRGNLHLQLMYKALFELSADRAEFVSRLFSKKRPEGLTAMSPAQQIFSAFWDVETSDDLYHKNLAEIQQHLTVKHGFALSAEDLKGIEYVYHAFYWYGPRIQYSSTGSFGGSFQPTYAALMSANDGNGQERGYLASEEHFAFMKSLETRNMLVPVVGNFAGPSALRAVGRYLKEKGAMVSAFYLSNVEQYLRQDNVWRSFCENVAALPLDETSMFIRSVRGAGSGQPTFGLSSELGNMASEVKDCRP